MTEFDLAYHHNVAVKRKKRLIVLIMLDRPTDLYANDASDTATLRQYLRQYTYIDYTADDSLFSCYDGRRSTMQCHLRMKLKEPHCGLFIGKAVNVATPSSLGILRPMFLVEVSG